MEREDRVIKKNKIYLSLPYIRLTKKMKLIIKKEISLNLIIYEK